MERALGTKVRIIEKGRKGGRIEIEYYSQKTWTASTTPSLASE